MPSMPSSQELIPLLCGVAAFAVVVLVWSGLISDDPLPDRLKAVAERREDLENPTQRRKRNAHREKMQRLSLMKRAVEWLKLTQGQSMTELRLKLRRAGYQSRDAMFAFLFAKFALLAGLGALGVFLFFVVGVGGKIPGGLRPAAALAFALVGWMGPDILIKNKSQKREDVLRKGMPDALDLMVICAEAGLGMDAAFDRVGRELASTAPELAEEIGLTGVELNFLPDRHQALRNLAERVPQPSVSALVNTLIQTEKYGTPLAQALRVLSGEMREERMMVAEEKAARLPAVLTVPMILFILPPLFVVLIGPAAIKVSEAMAHAH